jgi:hypothetical protein
MTAAINNGDAHSPVVFQGFGFGRSGDGFDIGQFERGLGFHGEGLKNENHKHTRATPADWSPPVQN